MEANEYPENMMSQLFAFLPETEADFESFDFDSCPWPISMPHKVIHSEQPTEVLKLSDERDFGMIETTLNSTELWGDGTNIEAGVPFELFNIKSEFDQFSSMEFKSARRRCNPYSNVVPLIRSSGAIKICSAKLLELQESTNLLKDFIDILRKFNPGQNINRTFHYSAFSTMPWHTALTFLIPRVWPLMDTWRKNKMKVKLPMTATLFYFSDDPTPPESLTQSLAQWTHNPQGKNFRGSRLVFPNVTKAADIVEHTDFMQMVKTAFDETRGLGLRFAVLDPSEGMEAGYNKQSLIYEPFFAASVAFALSPAIAAGGTCLIKVYDPWTDAHTGLMWLLYKAYDSFSIVRPIATRQSSAERFILLRDRRVHSMWKGVARHVLKCVGQMQTILVTSSILFN
eukprot:gnl/Dysnectes_brevis/5410_a7764_537.p1 GENE.gnl/Dysnectes_brevis/5410_a7764_537~~gnl/Dysnectes_brevis/5410_a7764_537.p1  ORF type:complete len:409 (-),score=88.42 gnl/Dysnectes_brevis/5410_a7764_537:800-1993(-)